MPNWMDVSSWIAPVIQTADLIVLWYTFSVNSFFF